MCVSHTATSRVQLQAFSPHNGVSAHLEHVREGYGGLYLLQAVSVRELHDAAAPRVDVADHVPHVLLGRDDVHLQREQ